MKVLSQSFWALMSLLIFAACSPVKLGSDDLGLKPKPRQQQAEFKTAESFYDAPDNYFVFQKLRRGQPPKIRSMYFTAPTDGELKVSRKKFGLSYGCSDSSSNPYTFYFTYLGENTTTGEFDLDLTLLPTTVDEEYFITFELKAGDTVQINTLMQTRLKKCQYVEIGVAGTFTESAAGSSSVDRDGI